MEAEYRWGGQLSEAGRISYRVPEGQALTALSSFIQLASYFIFRQLENFHSMLSLM